MAVLQQDTDGINDWLGNYQAKWSHCHVSSCGNRSPFAQGPATDPSTMTRVVSGSRKEKADRPIGPWHKEKIIVGRDSCRRLETRSNIHRESNACRSVGAVEAGDHCIITISTSGTGNTSTSTTISNSVRLHILTFDSCSLIVAVGQLIWLQSIYNVVQFRGRSSKTLNRSLITWCSLGFFIE